MRVGSDMTGRHRFGTPSARLDLALRNPRSSSPSRTTVRPHTHPAYSRRQADDDRRQGRALIIQFAATAGHNCRDFILFVRRKHVLRGSGTKFAAHACTHLSPHISRLHHQTLLESLTFTPCTEFLVVTSGSHLMAMIRTVYLLRP